MSFSYCNSHDVNEMFCLLIIMCPSGDTFKRFVAMNHKVTSALFTLPFTMMYDIKQRESYSTELCSNMTSHWDSKHIVEVLYVDIYCMCYYFDSIIITHSDFCLMKGKRHRKI